MFTRILVAVDSDEIAEAVVATASGLAQPLNAQVALLHVVDSARVIAPLAAATEPVGLGVPPLTTAANVGVTEQLLDDQERSGETFVQSLAQRLPAGLAAELLLREGAPAEAIVATAQEWQAELIIIGTHGRGGLERLIVGSTAEAVLRAATCPVLTIRAGVQPS